MRTIPFAEAGMDLPIGFLVASSNGQPPVVHRTFELGPVTGRVRIAMSAEGVKDNQGRVTTELLFGTMKRLGTLTALTRDLIRRFPFPDREYVGWVHMLRRLQGKKLPFNDACRACQVPIEVEADPDQFLVNVLEDGDYEVHSVQLPGDDTARPVQTFVFTSGFGTARMRLLTGEDEERHAGFHSRNPEEGQLRDRYACLVTYNDKVLTYDAFLDLDQEVLGWFTDCAESIELGSNQRVRITCPACGKEQVFGIDPLGLLQRLAPTPVLPPYGTRSSTSPLP